MAEPTRIPSTNDWNTAHGWEMNTTEPLGATEKRINWSLDPNMMVQIGFPERVPGTGPAYTAPFKVADVFGNPVGSNPTTEFSLKIPISQRNLEWWLFLAPPP